MLLSLVVCSVPRFQDPNYREKSPHGYRTVSGALWIGTKSVCSENILVNAHRLSFQHLTPPGWYDSGSEGNIFDGNHMVTYSERDSPTGWMVEYGNMSKASSTTIAYQPRTDRETEISPSESTPWPLFATRETIQHRIPEIGFSTPDESSGLVFRLQTRTKQTSRRKNSPFGVRVRVILEICRTTPKVIEKSSLEFQD